MNSADDEILVSVFCMAYNHEKYIQEALEGFVNQVTDFRYEVIIHDDASQDNTAQIIREYEKKYPDIIKPIYQKENQYSKKIPIVSTYIMPQLKGKYIAICEGDDCWTDSKKLQSQVDILEKNASCSACVHQTIKLDCRTNKEADLSFVNHDGVIDKAIVIEGGGKAFHLSSLMCRREYFFNRPDFCRAIPGVGDYPLAIYLALCGEIYYINKPMSLYRLHSCATSWVSRNDTVEKQQRLTDNILKMLKMADEYSDFKYTDLFKSAAVYNQYKLNVFENSRQVIKNPEFFELFRKETAVFKIKYTIKLCLKGKILDRIKAIKERINKNG